MDYGDEDAQFNEDGSFIGEYAGQKERASMEIKGTSQSKPWKDKILFDIAYINLAQGQKRGENDIILPHICNLVKKTKQ